MVSADVAVVGLGAFGAATLYQLARMGVRAVGIDRFAPPHDRGSSHGDTRITRVGVAEGEVYVPFVLRSHEIWRELEAETGERLFLECGMLIVDGAANAEFHGKRGFGARTIAAARHAGIVHSVLTPVEAMKAFPQFGLEGHETVYFEPGAGAVFPDKCIAVQLAQAQALGATMITGDAVSEVRPVGAGVELRTASGMSISAGHAVIAAGGWTPAMAGSALGRMRLLRQTLHWFEPEDWSLYAPEACPTFIWAHGDRAEQSFYGFPAIDGTARRGVKVGTEQYSHTLARPEDMAREVPQEEGTAFHAEQLEGRLLGLTPQVLGAAACLYTAAPDGDFAIDRHPDSERITVVSACSGHGFKHAPGVGEHIAALACGTQEPIAEFSLARAALAP